jgi:hypothetical protein
MNFCPNCHVFISDYSDHVCLPKWQALVPDYDEMDGEDFRDAFGVNSESAALEIAERKFSDWEYPREIEVWVRQNPTDEWEKFEITVESVPSFSASRKGN